MSVTNKKFTDPALNRYDVMQHIRNIYDIIGVTNPSTFKRNDSANMVAFIDNIAEKTVIGWSGTREEFKVAKASGQVDATTVCAITDDYYNPYNNN